MADEPQGCARVTGAVMGEDPSGGEDVTREEPAVKEARMTARVGRKAPDFEAPAYHRGGFRNVKLSDHIGTWVLLCFYPGDFTFV